MLNDIYVHERLASVRASARPDSLHALEVASLRRRNSPARRLARLIGRGLHNVAEALLAYAADRPRRLSMPLPPIVELRPTRTPYSQN
jgi:hypothetical protein